MYITLTKSACIEFSRSQPFVLVDNKNVTFLLVQGVHLSHGNLISCFYEKEGRTWCFSCICYFSSAFHSKESIQQSGIFWGDVL